MDFKAIQANNPKLPIIHADDPAFAAYGEVLSLNTQAYLQYAEQSIIIPDSGVDYTEEDPALAGFHKEKAWLENNVYGQMPIAVGYCAGHNRIMNGMEWHHGCEVNVAFTDVVLFLAPFSSLKGRRDQLKLDSADVQAVYVPRGYAVALDPLVLHFTPIEVEQSGFSVLVALPKHTNEALKEPAQNPYLKARNSWIIYHKDTGRGDDFDGENLQLRL
ncbi:MAG TPA: DUF4867 family protein [Clostridiales bacterium]|nr:DUF4867 family protein [Clostridiales bacterium]